MKKIKILLVQFEQNIHTEQLNALRGAIVAKVGREHIAFHNHIGDNGFLYQYPLIQYKSIRGKAAIMCIGDGVDEIQKLFAFANWDINLNGEPLLLSLHQLHVNNHKLIIWNKPIAYRIKNWIALNEENFEKYKNTTSLVERIQLLERILIGNILSFAKGIQWQLDETCIVQIMNIDKEKRMTFKDIQLASFDVSFNCNIYLPRYIGLGKHVSIGCGVVQLLNTNKLETNNEHE